MRDGNIGSNPISATNFKLIITNNMEQLRDIVYEFYQDRGDKTITVKELLEILNKRVNRFEEDEKAINWWGLLSNNERNELKLKYNYIDSFISNKDLIDIYNSEESIKRSKEEIDLARIWWLSIGYIQRLAFLDNEEIDRANDSDVVKFYKSYLAMKDLGV